MHLLPKTLYTLILVGSLGSLVQDALATPSSTYRQNALANATSLYYQPKLRGINFLDDKVVEEDEVFAPSGNQGVKRQLSTSSIMATDRAKKRKVGKEQPKSDNATKKKMMILDWSKRYPDYADEGRVIKHLNALFKSSLAANEAARELMHFSEVTKSLETCLQSVPSKSWVSYLPLFKSEKRCYSKALKSCNARNSKYFKWDKVATETSDAASILHRGSTQLLGNYAILVNTLKTKHMLWLGRYVRFWKEKAGKDKSPYIVFTDSIRDVEKEVIVRGASEELLTAFRNYFRILPSELIPEVKLRNMDGATELVSKSSNVVLNCIEMEEKRFDEIIKSSESSIAFMRKEFQERSFIGGPNAKVKGHKELSRSKH
ncbi:MAG: hypothetical protein DHS80DRAFT_29415 [Piptocephalis tieghemiana]|nr:MAG: hypothetical protein DHS80DRAFT_29415 [Piptocephalis tieghemiana]